MVTLLEKKTSKGYAVKIYVNNDFRFVSFSKTSFLIAKRTALHTISNNRELSQMTILN